MGWGNLLDYKFSFLFTQHLPNITHFKKISQTLFIHTIPIVITDNTVTINNPYEIENIFEACICYFYKFKIFLSYDSPSKTVKNIFISSKKLFLFLRYSNFCDFFPFLPHFPNSKGQIVD